jgi:N6-L-threonylcarbamoyladenine synthase
MVKDLVAKTLNAARTYDVRTLFVSGGVAANLELRTRLSAKLGWRRFASVFSVARPFNRQCGHDCGAAFPKFLRREFVAMDFSAEAGMALR